MGQAPVLTKKLSYSIYYNSLTSGLCDERGVVEVLWIFHSLRTHIMLSSVMLSD